MSRKERLVVVGNGMAGARFVEELLARGGRDRFDIAVLGDERYGNYNRILLSSVLAGTHAPNDVFLNPLPWYAQNGVTLHAGAKVTAIDRARRVVHAGELAVPYDRLVLATGSSAFVPPIRGLHREGALIDGAFVFRTLDDCAAIRKHAERARRAVVIGGGLLGLEAAKGLLSFGLSVHVVHLASHLMEVQLDPIAGKILARSVAAMGVQLHLATETVAVHGESRVEGVEFRSGELQPCELLVVAAGIRPNVELARAAGITIGRGIVVDDGLATSDPHVFAIGECAEHRRRLYGLVAPLWEQARVLAERLVARHASYAGSKISTKLKVAGVELATMGERDGLQPDDEIVTYSEEARGIYKKLVVRDGKLVGAILLGDASAAPTLHSCFDRADSLPDARAELLFPSRGAASTNVADLGDDAQICNCNGVTKGTIVAAVRAGRRSLAMLCDSTRAGTGCGSCKGRVQELLEHAGGDAVTEDPSVHWYVPGVPLSKPDLLAAIRARALRSVSSVFRELAGGKEDPGSKPGLASLLKTVWGKDYEDERDARFVNDRVHANVQKDGSFSVVPRIYGGVTSPSELRRIADVAEKYGVKMVKITGGQRIDLLGVAKDDLPHIWRDLGMPSGHAYTKAFRTCKTCVGSDFCRYGVGDSTALGIAIERRYQGLEAPAKVKFATAGCPRNCSEATVKDVGVVAIEGGRWEIWVGGAAGSRVRKADLLSTVDSHDEVLRISDRFLQYYRENAKYLERSYDFVERVGVETLRRLLVDDEQGICARLDAELQAAVDAYVDPWSEAERPVNPTQFTALIPASALLEKRAAGGAR